MCARCAPSRPAGRRDPLAEVVVRRCKLMATVGKLLDRKEAQHYMDYYFAQMKEVPPPAPTTHRPTAAALARHLWPGPGGWMLTSRGGAARVPADGGEAGQAARGQPPQVHDPGAPPPPPSPPPPPPRTRAIRRRCGRVMAWDAGPSPTRCDSDSRWRGPGGVKGEESVARGGAAVRTWGLH